MDKDSTVAPMLGLLHLLRMAGNELAAASVFISAPGSDEGKLIPADPGTISPGRHSACRIIDACLQKGASPSAWPKESLISFSPITSLKITVTGSSFVAPSFLSSSSKKRLL